MNASELFRSLREEGFQLWREGDELRYRAPKGLLSPGLIKALTALKPEIIPLLEVQSVAGSCFQAWSPPPSNSEEACPLSFAQERMWFLQQLEPEGCSLNVAIGFSLNGPLDVAALERSLSELIDRHEAFRSTCAASDAQLLQVIVPAGETRLSLKIVDLRNIPEPERDLELQRQITCEARRPFALDRSPLLHATLFQVAPDRHALLLVTHHFVVDGWSVGVMLRDLSALYDGNSQGRRPSLETITSRYCDYATWQRKRLTGQLLEELLTYWRGKLDGVAELNLPTDRPVSASPSGRGATHRFDLPSGLSEALKVLSRREGVTLFTTLLAAFKTLLHRYSGQNDIVVGTAVSDRCMAETQTLVGCFANTLVLQTACDSEPTFRQLLHRVHDTAIEAFEHQDMPFDLLVEQLRPERLHLRNPLFRVSFLLHQHAEDERLKLNGLEV
ncbi:MAG TPA: condensation domain-containing protein, partial [Terrimicrobiaceae bacterium]|nr:condensation domain-containing protein [Terrimicrobiaceae bacterium]